MTRRIRDGLAPNPRIPSFGAFLVVVGAIGFAIAPDPASVWAPLFAIGPLLGLVPVILLVRAYGKRLPG